MSKKKKKHLQRKPNQSKKKKKSNTHHICAKKDPISNAIAYIQEGNFINAKKTLTKLIKKAPSDIEVLFYLGVLEKSQGKFDEAMHFFDKALKIYPEYVSVYNEIGGIYIDKNDPDQATKFLLKGASLSPDDPLINFNLAVAAGIRRDLDKALKYYQKAIENNVDRQEIAYYNIGCILLDQNKLEESIRCFKKVLDIDPKNVEAYCYLGRSFQNIGNNDHAEKYYKKAIAIMPDHFNTHQSLALFYQSQFKHDEALSHFEKCISIMPERPETYLNIANTFRAQGDVEKTIEYYEKSIAIEPSLVAYTNLCGYQKELCNYDEVINLTNKVLEFSDLKKADLGAIHDTYIQVCEWEKASSIIEKFRDTEFETETRDVIAGCFMELCAITDLSLDEIADLHKTWGTHTEQATRPFVQDINKWRSSSRKKLRIAYVSPDLREHSVGYLIKDIITSHNYKNFEVYCYANFKPTDCDSFTQEIINSCTMLKYVNHLTDKAVADEIYKDEINILIDLAGHTAGHRLRSAAYKPAPIQMTYLGYPHTTGLSRIDYRITDRFAETDTSKDYRYSEQLLRLTNCFLTFKGFGDIVPAEIKENINDKIIFGCFNNIQKLQPKAVELWSKILKSVENSELHLKAKQLNTPVVWKNIIKEFAAHNIPEHRIVCLGYSPTKEEHLKLYNTIDISLDPFPYNGTVTTLEALWMNMPVITLVGESHAQRVSYSILKNLNLDSLIAYSENEYVSKAVELAKNPELIIELKKKMRKNLLASSICNPIVFVRELELNLKKIWMEYLNSGLQVADCDIENEKNRQNKATPNCIEDIGSAITDASKLRLAMVKLRAGEFEQAKNISSNLIGNNGVSHLAWYVLGVSRYHLGDEKKAMEALIKSINLNSKNTGAWKILGEIYLTQDKIEKANECLKNVWDMGTK